MHFTYIRMLAFLKYFIVFMQLHEPLVNNKYSIYAIMFQLSICQCQYMCKAVKKQQTLTKVLYKQSSSNETVNENGLLHQNVLPFKIEILLLIQYNNLWLVCIICFGSRGRSSVEMKWKDFLHNRKKWNHKILTSVVLFLQV